MAARRASLAFAAAVMALESPVAAQIEFPSSEVPGLAGRVAEVDQELDGPEAAARWDGDPCGKIYRAAVKLRDRFAKYDDDRAAALDAASEAGWGILGMRLYLHEDSDHDFPWHFVRDWRARVDRLLKICPNETGVIGDPYIMKAVQPEQPNPPSQAAGENKTGNPNIKGLNNPGGSNRQPESNGNAQRQNEDRAASATTEHKRSKDRPRRNRQPDRCERNQDQVPANCPGR